GYLKAGILGDYIPGSVIKGMLAAIGLIFILKQFLHLVGYDADYDGDESFLQIDGDNTFSSLLGGLNHLIPAALLIGIASLLLQIIWEKWVTPKAKILQLIPAPLIVVLSAV